MFDTRLLTRLDKKKSQLDALRPLPLGIVRRLNKQLITEWIYNANGLEGNRLTLKETQAFLETGATAGGKTLREHFEVLNTQKAIKYIRYLVTQTGRFTPHHICKVHRLLLEQIDDENAGQYRPISIQIADENLSFPDSWKMNYLVTDWANWLNSTALSLHSIERAALAHCRFLAIEPFTERNGQIARLFMNLLLMRDGYPITIIKKVHHRQYQNVLSQAKRGYPPPLVNFIARAVEHSLTLFLNICTPKIGEGSEQWILLRDVAKKTFYNDVYLAFLARKGRLEAVKRGGRWYTTERAVYEYRQSLE